MLLPTTLLARIGGHIIQITGSGQYRNKKLKKRQGVSPLNGNEKSEMVPQARKSCKKMRSDQEDSRVPAERKPQATAGQVKRRAGETPSAAPQMINEGYARCRLEDFNFQSSRELDCHERIHRR